MENKRKLGSEKESVAAAYLEASGLQILDRNYYFPGLTQKISCNTI